jgi:hypothetical protein
VAKQSGRSTGGGKNAGGKSGGKGTGMSKEAASRVQSAGDRNPSSDTAKSGFASRAQSAADRDGGQRR